MVDCRATHEHIQSFKDLCTNDLGVKYMVRAFDSVGRGEENRSELESPPLTIFENDADEEKENKQVSIKKEEKYMPDIFGCKTALIEFCIAYRDRFFLAVLV